ncbi:transporter [Bacteroidia bacterium]|nr:transporter [Bacteroidia bacterium]
MKKILLAALVLTAFAAAAQDSVQNKTLTITLDKALEIALSDNPTIKIADYEIDRVDYSKKAAWGALLPSLSASGQFTHFTVPGKIFQMGNELDIPTIYQLKAGLSLQLPIIVPALWQAINMSALDMQLSVEKARASKITLRSDVTKAYYNILLAQDSYKALQEGYKIAEENHNLAKNRYENGMAAEYDYISAEVQMNNLLPNLLQVENAMAQAKLYLKVLMGLSKEVEIVANENLANFEAQVARAKDDSLALANNPDLLQIDIQQRQLDKAISLQNTNHLPTLVGFGSYGYTGSPSRDMNLIFGADPDATPPNPGMPVTMKGQSGRLLSDGLVLGLQLNIPIFSGMSNVYKTRQLKIQRKELDLQREYVEQNLSVQVRTAIDNMEKAVRQMESNKKAVELADKAYKISNTRYNVGASTMLELNNSALALTQSKLSYHQAISDYLSAKADFEKIVGQ